MKRYVCMVCGYVYDEAKGIPEAGIRPGTKWDELPADWKCPICGASKSEFAEEGAKQEAKPASKPAEAAELRALTALEASALCSNLARGCEKQYKPEEAAQFTELAEYYRAAASVLADVSFDRLMELVQKDLETGIPSAKTAAQNDGDRGALRALVWSEKVTRILASLLSQYAEKGAALYENTGIYVCTICGFIYIGDTPPELCPVCKVPRWKFDKVYGR